MTDSVKEEKSSIFELNTENCSDEDIACNPILRFLIKHGYKTYEEYLLSDEWKELREKTLNKFHNRCVICGDKTNLQVHHIDYMNMENPELLCLCRDCHSFWHKAVRDNFHRAISELNLKFADDTRLREVEKAYRDSYKHLIKRVLQEFLNQKDKHYVVDPNMALLLIDRSYYTERENLLRLSRIRCKESLRTEIVKELSMIKKTYQGQNK